MNLPNVSYCENENEVHYNPLILQPNNEIWYTSTDGNIIRPSEKSEYAFGVNISIVSNTYENGKGIIKLEKECNEIGYRAFSGCTSLASISFSSKITFIDKAFQNCNKLSSITILPETPPALVSNAFSSIASNAVIYVPSGSVDAYKTAANWSTYADIIQPIP